MEIPEWQEQVRDLVEVEIEPTSACTRQCWFCHPGVPAARRVHPHYLSIERFTELTEELKALGYRGARQKGWITFAGIGEPLLHPEIVEMVRIARDVTHTHIITNGDLVTRDFLRQVRPFLSRLTWSRYDPNPECERLLPYHLESHQYQINNHYKADRRYSRRAGNIGPVDDAQRERVKRMRHKRCRRIQRALLLGAEGRWRLCCNDMRDVHHLDAHTVADLFANETYMAIRRNLCYSDNPDRSQFVPCNTCGSLIRAIP